nr:AI-2E family transporter [Schaalia vaccimaxillae]
MPFGPGDSLKSDRDAAEAVPWSIRVGAAISWRAIIVAVAAAGLLWLGTQLTIIIMPLAIALLLAVLLEPFVGWLVKKLRFSPTLAAAAGLIVLLVIIVTALSQAGNEIIQQLPRLFTKASAGVGAITEWMEKGPLKLDASYIGEGLKTVQNEITLWAQKNSDQLATGALSVTSSVVTLVSSTLVMFFCLFFFLREGRRIWLWVVRLFPAPARVPLHESAIRGWVTLGSYVRTQIQVAAIDAVGIGLGAFFLGVPMVLPIAVVVFFASFVPIVGALVSGAIAVFVALVDQGLTAGIIMLVIILVVQQIESNLLQPLLMSNAVSLHPMAVLLVVTAAGSIAGIPGAIFGVPIAAFINATFLYLHGYDSMPELQTKQDRAGGPPGMLEEMVSASYGSASRVSSAVDPVASQGGDELPAGTPTGLDIGAQADEDEDDADASRTEGTENGDSANGTAPAESESRD